MYRHSFILALAILVCSGVGVLAIEELEITPEDLNDADGFGYSVGISGEFAIVGAWESDEDSVDAGAAYVFQREGEEWNEDVKLTTDDPLLMGKFGTSISIGGDFVFVSAPYNMGFIGQVSVFHQEDEDWTLQQVLVPEERDTVQLFGHAVAVEGDYVIISSIDEDESCVFIYARDGEQWSLLQRLLPDEDDERGIDFGERLDITEDFAVVSTFSSVYIFEREDNEWIREVRLEADEDDELSFGGAVGVDGNYIVVGARRYDGRLIGEAYVFVRTEDGWEQHQQLIPSDVEENLENLERYGTSVSIDGSWAIVAATECSYVFELVNAEWIERHKIERGGVVSIDGTERTAIIGKSYSEDRPDGAAWVYWDLDQLDVDIEKNPVPFNFQLFQSYPNPFNMSTRVAYALLVPSDVVVSVYDIYGKLISTPVNALQSAGRYSFVWNADDVPNGVYFARLTSGSYSQTIKVMLIR